MGLPALDELAPDALESARELELVSLTGHQLAGADLRGRTFRSCRLVRTALTAADLRRTTFDEVEFEDCDLSSVRLDDAQLHEVSFRGCKLLGVDWSTATRSLIGQPLLFERCQLDFGVFRAAKLRGSVFRDCSAREVDLVGADLADADFAGTNLERARFGETRLTGASLVGATGYALDPRENEVHGLRVGLPDGAELLRVFGIAIEE
jgi:uncharacterized protein YjbI with pentapeptide repeats